MGENGENNISNNSFWQFFFAKHELIQLMQLQSRKTLLLGVVLLPANLPIPVTAGPFTACWDCWFLLSMWWCALVSDSGFGFGLMIAVEEFLFKQEDCDSSRVSDSAGVSVVYIGGEVCSIFRLNSSVLTMQMRRMEFGTSCSEIPWYAMNLESSQVP